MKDEGEDEDDIKQSWKDLLAKPHEWWDIRLEEVRGVALIISLSLFIFVVMWCIVLPLYSSY